MSYEVDNRAEAKKALDELGISRGDRHLDEIRKAHGSHRHNIQHVGEAERLDLHADAAPGQLAADYAALEQTRQRLTAQADAVSAMISEALHLATPMNDGHGPVAYAMKATFAERADEAQGALRALREYHAELGKVIQALTNTMRLYNQIDSDAAQHLQSQGGDNV